MAGFGLVLADDEDKSAPAEQEQAGLGFDARIVGTYDPRITLPKILVQTIPGYIGEARSSDLEGTALLVCVIRRTGRAESFLVERHPGQQLQEGVIREIELIFLRRGSLIGTAPTTDRGPRLKYLILPEV